MKHLNDTQLAGELENRRNALHNACQLHPELRAHLGPIMNAIHEAAMRLRSRHLASIPEAEVPSAPKEAPPAQQPRKRSGGHREVETA